MAWTTPRTWTDGELVTKAIMDVHVRDNLNAIGPIMRMRKTADQSVTSSTVLVDDTHLTFAIAANEVWQYQLGLWLNSGAGGYRLQMTGPAGSTGIALIGWNITGGAFDGATAALGANIINSAVTYTNEPAFLQGTVVNSGTAGNFRLQWAQQTSNGTASTINANSYMIAHRIA